MPRFNRRGQQKVYWVPTITVPSAPTVAQIAAGVNITPYIKSTTGFKYGSSTEDASDMDSLNPKTVAGPNTLEDSSITIYEGDAAGDGEKVFELLVPIDTTGFIVFSPAGLAIATKKVRVWPVRVISNAPDETADSGAATVTIAFAVPSAPTMTATSTA